jgi:dimethylamine---corrinoid protein Co-methyltransferase
MGKIITRMGDGFRVEMTEQEVQKDLEAGTLDAADRAKISPLKEDELKYLYEIFACPYRVVGVEHGHEVCLSYDGSSSKMKRAGISVSKIQTLQILERALGADSLELSHVDYSFKAVKPIVSFNEKPIMEQAVLTTIPPLLYGAMPNLGLYSQPDGPCPNPADLLPNGKIAEARASYEQAIELATNDMVYVGSVMYEAGADGINFDTTAAAGDAEFLAALQAVEILRMKYPEMGIQMGMAGEFILGMHGEVTYKGVRLAGLYPHDQVRLAKQAGVSIFGPAINIVTNESLPWNIARSVTYTKACSEISEIPVHACLGMGVGGVPITLTPPLDALSRASKAHVEICRLDGL